MDLIITLPSETEWSDYLKELHAAERGEVLNFKVATFPRSAAIGSRVYVVWRGAIRGWMTLTGMHEKEFTSTRTGKKWEGKFLELSGNWYPLDPPMVTKGFQGYRYFTLKK